MAEVSPQDRDLAESITTAWETSGEGYGHLDELIAQALADERARAHESFLPSNPDVGKVSLRLEVWPHDAGANGEDYVAGHISATEAARYLREAAERCASWADPECPWPDDHGVSRKPVDEAQMRAEAVKRAAREGNGDCFDVCQGH